MSYLDTTHLIFSGDFISDVSTVNNDPAHYNNATFKPSFQEFGQGGTNGWWNPEGGATFDFQNCAVTRISMGNGQVISDAGKDIVIGQIVCGAEGRNTGKMVDLDPQEQGSSELWGVKLRLVTTKNELLFEGDIKPTGFRDLQYRQHSGSNVNGQPLGGTWTSVIENIVWGKLAESSTFIKELKAKTNDNKLSLNLNGFGYYYLHAADGRFSLGRILGCIGPWYDNEPETFASCRRLYGNYDTSLPNDRQAIFFSTTNFLFNRDNKVLTADFGSSFPISNSTGNISFNEKIILGVSKVPVTAPPSNSRITIKSEQFAMIGQVPYETGPDWLNNTGGIVTFDNLSAEVTTLLENNQLLLLLEIADGEYMVIARESINGYYVRADDFVNRLDYLQVNDINFYAYQWGEALKNTKIDISLDKPTSITPKGPNNPISEIPGNNYPQDGLTFEQQIVTGSNGHAILKLKGNRIDSPRVYLDGQIYTLNYALNGIQNDPAKGPMSNDNIYVHLRDYFEVPEQPVWSDISATMIQFSNLYPIMSKYFIDLADPEALIAKKDILIFAFTRDISDPIYMPATRDLSEQKKQTILKWLNAPVVDTDTPPAVLVAAKLPQKAEAPAADSPVSDAQQRLKNIVRAKNGAGFAPFDIDQIFNN